MMEDLAPCKMLITAILYQAYKDAVSFDRACKPDAAMRFININDPWFCFYCDALGYEPDYVALKIIKRINRIRKRRLDAMQRLPLSA